MFAMSLDKGNTQAAMDSTSGALSSPSNTVSGTAIETVPKETTSRDQDVESLKPGLVAQVELGDEGAQRIELMQQVWGKHGKRWVFVGLAICMLA